MQCGQGMVAAVRDSSNPVGFMGLCATASDARNLVLSIAACSHEVWPMPKADAKGFQ